MPSIDERGRDDKDPQQTSGNSPPAAKVNKRKKRAMPHAKAKPTRKSQHHPDWADDGVNGRIKQAAYDKIGEWLALPDEEQRGLNHHLLTHGLPSGTIVSAKFRSNLDRMEVVADHKDWNTPRVFDLATFALLRLLTAFGGRYRMNDHYKGNMLRPGQTQLFPTVNLSEPTNVSLARLIWGSTTRSPVEQVEREKAPTDDDLCGTYTDFRMTNLISKDAMPAKRKRRMSKRGRKPRDRAAVINAALRYRKEREELRRKEPSRSVKKLILLPTAKGYREALEKCFLLLDELKEMIISQRVSSKP